ncbi:MAG: hypothetical protein PHQ53_06015 [Candidatus Krumholzibacteria bacterium]|nr:hypothetical protein [Candidatus Krumholzibacteria bacterium]
MMMNEPNLFVICLNAFVAVLALLSALALAMRLLIAAFPARAGQAPAAAGTGARGGAGTTPVNAAASGSPAATSVDAAMVAAISAAAQAVFPAACVARIDVADSAPANAGKDAKGTP